MEKKVDILSRLGLGVEGFGLANPGGKILFFLPEKGSSRAPLQGL